MGACLPHRATAAVCVHNTWHRFSSVNEICTAQPRTEHTATSVHTGAAFTCSLVCEHTARSAPRHHGAARWLSCHILALTTRGDCAIQSGQELPLPGVENVFSETLSEKSSSESHTYGYELRVFKIQHNAPNTSHLYSAFSHSLSWGEGGCSFPLKRRLTGRFLLGDSTASGTQGYSQGHGPLGKTPSDRVYSKD